jgi:hypothetical protein
VLLAVLLAIVIMMLVYYVDVSTIFGPSLPRKTGKPQSRPWLEEERIVSAEKLITMPKPPKPRLDEPVTLTAAVTREGAERGRMIIEFAGDGGVTTYWSCEYAQAERYYAYTAESAGNIDVSKEYMENEIADVSKLYFITKGEYEKTIQKLATPPLPLDSEKGTIYVTGWLGADYGGQGKITITTDQTWSIDYEWRSIP